MKYAATIHTNSQPGKPLEEFNGGKAYYRLASFANFKLVGRKPPGLEFPNAVRQSEAKTRNGRDGQAA